jgi:hypothetical protein
MSYIVLPSSSSKQGFAFEDLILSYYQQSGVYTICERSTYLHGASGKWYQCDGIVENTQGRYLVEAKFFRDRPAAARDIDPDRRERAAFDLGCTGLIYLSLNGFHDDMLTRKHPSALDVQFFSWDDIRSNVMATMQQYNSVLLDQFDLIATQATAATGETLFFDTMSPSPFSPTFPEFVMVPDGLEEWLRRLPRLDLIKSQCFNGKFVYEATDESVQLISERASHLSLKEAWDIQDAFSGYASRTYTAVRATAEALATIQDGLIDDIQSALHAKGWTTGTAGVRDSLTFLVQLKLAHAWRDGRKSRYALTSMGRAYTAQGTGDDLFFDHILREWLPYRFLHQAIVHHSISPNQADIIAYFKEQYAPYEPYARSLFNPNKTEGLLKLYKHFGA